MEKKYLYIIFAFILLMSLFTLPHFSFSLYQQKVQKTYKNVEKNTREKKYGGYEYRNNKDEILQ